MVYDISKSISQRSCEAETEENRRILEIASELCGRCKLYEAQLRDGQEYVSPLDVEQRVAEQYAKDNDMWLPIEGVFNLGMPGPSGHENDTYVSNDIIYKVNNLLNNKSIIRLFEKILLHNILFYDTAYSLYASRVLKEEL